MAERALATAFVNIVPGTADLEQYLKGKLRSDVEGSAEEVGKGFGSKFSNGFKGSIASLGAAVASTFALNRIMGWADTSIKSVARIEKISTQTTSALKTTGASAWTTTGHINDLAGSLENTTATEAEQIQTGANLLLTFKNIRNAAGKNNDVFDQSVIAMTDMARAMGTDASTGAIQLGKALNDPTQGISALTRVGVTFSEEQKNLIKKLQDSGDIMGAQKIILAELTSEFGGSGAAYAGTYAGKMDLLGHAMGTLGESIVTGVMPALQKFADMATPIFNWMASNPDVVQALAIMLGVLAAAFLAVSVAMWAVSLTPVAAIIGGIVIAIGALIAGVVWLIQNWSSVTAWFSTIWQNFTTFIGDAWNRLWANVLKPVFDAVGAAFTFLYEKIILPVAQSIVAAVIIVGAIFGWLYDNAIKPALDAVGSVFSWLWTNAVRPAIDLIVNYIKMWASIFTWLYENIVKPAFDGIANVFDWVWKHAIQPFFDWLGTAAKAASGAFTAAFTGIGDFLKSCFDGLVSIVRGPINALIDFVNGAIDGINRIQIDIPDWARGLFGGATKLGFNIPRIPHLAAGGYVTQPTTALIGEAGPEVVTPLKDFERMMGIGQGGSQVVNYYAAPNESIDADQALFTALKRAKVLAAW